MLISNFQESKKAGIQTRLSLDIPVAVVKAAMTLAVTDRYAVMPKYSCRPESIFGMTDENGMLNYRLQTT